MGDDTMLMYRTQGTHRSGQQRATITSVLRFTLHEKKIVGRVHKQTNQLPTLTSWMDESMEVE
jgi:hypothetical protein